MAQIIIAKVSGRELKALEAFLFALDLPFEKSKGTILDRRLRAARMEKQACTLRVVDPENVWESIT